MMPCQNGQESTGKWNWMPAGAQALTHPKGSKDVNTTYFGSEYIYIYIYVDSFICTYLCLSVLIFVSYKCGLV